MKFRAKVLLPTMIVCLMVVAFMFFVYFGVNNEKGFVLDAAARVISIQTQAHIMTSHGQQVNQAILNYIDRQDLQSRQIIVRSEDQIERSLQGLQYLVTGMEERDILDDYVRDRTANLSQENEILEAIDNGQSKEQVDSLYQRWLSANRDLSRELDNLMVASNSTLANDITERVQVSATLISKIILFSIIFVFGLLIFLSLFSQKFIVQPIRYLMTNAREVASGGSLDREIKINSQDELGELALAFNKMMKELKSSYSDLETKVHSRTAELREVAVRDEGILNGMAEGLIVTDNDNRISLINKAALTFLGKKQLGVIGKKIDKVVILYNDSAPTPEIAAAILLTNLFKEKDLQKKFYSLFSGKRKYVVAINNSPMMALNTQRKIGNIYLLNDVTRELELNKSKNEFVSLASHQLRTPLSAIKWFCEMILESDKKAISEENRHFVENVFQSNQRMIDLVNSLLNISRIESGRIIVDPRMTDLAVLARNSVGELQQRIKEKKLKVVFSINDHLPEISVDHNLIYEVYKNLLSNAVKYTPDGGEITVFISNKGKEIISQISDTGYGIPEKQQKRVFEKFFRGDNVIEVETDGTGLGLYLVNAIVKSSGGKVWFESKEGKGTTFWFSLPMEGMKPKKGDVVLNT